LPNDSSFRLDQDDKLDLLTAILASGMLNPGSDAEEAVEAFRLVRERLGAVLQEPPAEH
jgi:hypothetical protein